MEIIENLGLVIFTGLFFLAYVVLFVIIAVVSTQVKQRSAKRILKAQARGALADLGTSKNKFRFRFLAGIALFGVLGMVLSITVLVMQLATRFSNLYWVTIVIALIFGGIGSVAGLLMQREINRRL
ncbi:MAG TPA: hypothetical protein VK897_20525 [Anaerolineales bacterium]|nr:hypothetical protein [Anaerolineales bacterium]